MPLWTISFRLEDIMNFYSTVLGNIWLLWVLHYKWKLYSIWLLNVSLVLFIFIFLIILNLIDVCFSFFLSLLLFCLPLFFSATSLHMHAWCSLILCYHVNVFKLPWTFLKKDKLYVFSKYASNSLNFSIPYFLASLWSGLILV